MEQIDFTKDCNARNRLKKIYEIYRAPEYVGSHIKYVFRMEVRPVVYQNEEYIYYKVHGSNTLNYIHTSNLRIFLDNPIALIGEVLETGRKLFVAYVDNDQDIQDIINTNTEIIKLEQEVAYSKRKLNRLIVTAAELKSRVKSLSDELENTNKCVVAAADDLAKARKNLADYYKKGE